MATTRPVRICLAASGGGHLRQLLDLRPFWEEQETHFITEDTPLAEGLAASNRVYLVPHFAFGQLRLQPFWKVAAAASRNMKAAWRVVRTERPQMVVSTGAGAVFFPVLFAKVRGARFVLVESFARFEAPSLFARLARRFADVVIVQSKRLHEIWPDAEFFDPFVLLDAAVKPKEDLGFLTVGTVMPFDRLVKAVASLPKNLRPSQIVAQVGRGGTRPEGMDVREVVDFGELTEILDRTNLVFCHGGTGSLITALRAGCRIVAMPRRADLGEHYDDHQQEIVSAFSARGLIEVAAEASEMKAALIERLRSLMSEWFPKQSGHYSK
jgi:UDP-N-acetylglucosamine transferase subunit ALG13